VPITPFVVGQWVRGSRFYGRSALIEEILTGPRDWIWLLGTRRIGKTSVLKQLELVASAADEPTYFALFWDLQGAGEPEELHASFAEALLEVEERLTSIGIRRQDVEAPDLLSSLGRLRRELRARGRKLLLLCDEVEELIPIRRRDPAFLGKLRRALQSQESVRSVLAATIRLWELAQDSTVTSPFLHGFTPPLCLRGLEPEASRALIAQSQLPEAARPQLHPETIEAIRRHADDHPFLMQLLAKRCVEHADLDDAVEELAADPMVRYFFSVDFDMLGEIERAVLHAVVEHEASTSATIRTQVVGDEHEVAGALQRLEQLGYARRDAEKRYVLANSFFRRWLREHRTHVAAPAGPPLERTQPTTFDGRYTLLQLVGSGATGTVYKARDELLRTTLAIKFLKPEHVQSEEALERLRREVVLSRDIAHPNVVRTYHLGTSGSVRYLTLQWVEGPTLEELIRREAPLPLPRAIALATRLAEALESAHALHVLHRDLKPANILVNPAGEPCITDFGLARLLGDPGTTFEGTFLGTPAYASPEQADGLPVDERSDLYSLGVILFEMLTGRRPFLGDSCADVLELQRRADPPDPRTVRRDCSPELSRLVLRCLAKSRNLRPASAAELANCLRQLG
jgi:tRNA A-37 threonylcarbamoyl transferase component Bud32